MAQVVDAKYTKKQVVYEVRGLSAKQAMTSLERVTLDSNYINDLGYDSLDVTELTTEVEDHFGIKIPVENELPTLVQDAVNYVCEGLKKQNRLIKEKSK